MCPQDLKAKSLSKKLKVNKENDIDSFRHSDTRKSSSMISMSPNRKNRKYIKYTGTSLFSGSKQNLQRSSSSSFLSKTTGSFHNNSRNTTTVNSFLDKNLYQTCTSQSNFYRNQSKNQATVPPETQIKSYLQTMGFKSKAN